MRATPFARCVFSDWQSHLSVTVLRVRCLCAFAAFESETQNWQGLAITMEHNFMMSPAGRENFFNKWWQVVGSIQKTNDLDVHIALLSAPSYAVEIKNKYYSRTKTPHQIIREHIDMFGFMQKNVNALDILIEDAKITLQGWGAQAPSFMMCNSKLTMQVL